MGDGRWKVVPQTILSAPAGHSLFHWFRSYALQPNCARIGLDPIPPSDPLILLVPKTAKCSQHRALRQSSSPPPPHDNGLHTHTVTTSAFVLREDDEIETIGDARSLGKDVPIRNRDVPDLPPQLVHHDNARSLWLYHGNCLELLDAIAAKYPEGRFDCIFADPPYFLSNGGITCHAGRMVKVDKGDWDKSRGPELNHQFNLEWLRCCQRALKPNGTIWISGTHHVIFSVGYALQQLGYKILNDIAWEKPNPPPNLSCRYFTHSTETILWAAKNENSKHLFNYQAMNQVTGKQMKTVWTIGPPSNGEKCFGKHPTQKPVALVERCLLASTNEGDLVFDPFLGGGTTAVASVRLKRKCIGIELDTKNVEMAVMRVESAAGEQDELFS